MKRLIGLAIAACALATHAAGESATRAVSVSLEKGKVHEECMRLEAGEKRRFHWKASAPVDFNVHYHEGPEVFYPVKRERMRGDGGTFTAKVGQEYCWMWTARNAAATVEGGIDPAK
jgi:hypothetical protein